MEEVQGTAACSFIPPPLLQDRGPVYISWVRNVMLLVSEAWPLTKPDFQLLQRNDRAMIRQICKVKPEDVATFGSNELLAQLEIDYLDVILREKRLCWFGRVERSSGAIKTAQDVMKDIDRERPS